MDHFELPVETHNNLNPTLWENGRLKKPIHLALLKIAKAYWKYLGIDTPIVDIVISGSQANYNYSKHSDIDLHLIADYSKVSCDMDIDELFKAKRDLWKAEHEINIHNIPVEVYVEDISKPAVSSTYSLLKNQWINEPAMIETTPDVDRIVRVVESWMILITTRLATRDLELIEQVKDMLWSYRRKGLDIEGEMGVPNLVFKTLRNSGVTDMLLKAVAVLRDNELSLEDR